MALPEKQGSGLAGTIIGALIAVVVVYWLVGIVIGTVVLIVRIAVLVALVAGGFWLWDRFSSD